MQPSWSARCCWLRTAGTRAIRPTSMTAAATATSAQRNAGRGGANSRIAGLARHAGRSGRSSARPGRRAVELGVVAVVEQQVEGSAEAVAAVGQGGVGRGGTVELLAAVVVELAEGLVEQVVGVHGIEPLSSGPAASGHLGELGHGGVQAGLDGADRDLEDLGDLAVLQVLVVGQDQGLPEALGELGDPRRGPTPDAPRPASRPAGRARRRSAGRSGRPGRRRRRRSAGRG